MNVEKRAQLQIKIGEAKFAQIGVARNDAVDAARWLIVAEGGSDPRKSYGSPRRLEATVRALAAAVRNDPVLSAELSEFNGGRDLTESWVDTTAEAVDGR